MRLNMLILTALRDLKETGALRVSLDGVCSELYLLTDGGEVDDAPVVVYSWVPFAGRTRFSQLLRTLL